MSVALPVRAARPALDPRFRAALADLDVADNPAIVRGKSRDFYWYSPILKPLLDDKFADLVVIPRNHAEIVRVAAACAAFRVPMVVRGGGTGNYGQAVPLAGGVILDMTAMAKTLWIKPGAGRFEAGAKLADIDAAAAPSGWELRMYPSTKRLATIGGFVAGGAAGVGSVRYGQLRDRGSILGLRVVTLEPSPRILDLRGDDLAKVTHAYGTNGIITEVEIALAPSWPWVEAIVSFTEFAAAARFSQALAESDGIFLKLVSLVAWPLPRYFRPLAAHLPEGNAAVLVMVAVGNVEVFRVLAAAHGGAVTLERPHNDDRRTVPLYEYTWNHTTLQVLKTDRSVTYLQTIFPAGKNLAAVEALHARFGDEVMMHAEFQRRQGATNNSALQVVRFTTAERLWEIVRIHEEHGVRLSNPHSYILEDKGPKVISADHQLAFKREADPLGLMNPGKMSRWTPA